MEDMKIGFNLRANSRFNVDVQQMSVLDSIESINKFRLISQKNYKQIYYKNSLSLSFECV